MAKLTLFAKSQDLPEDPYGELTTVLVALEDGSVFRLRSVERYGRPTLEVMGYTFPNKLVIEPQVGNVICLTNDPDASVF